MNTTQEKPAAVETLAVSTEVKPDETAVVALPVPPSVLVPILGYLQTPQGHEMASRSLKLFEDLSKHTVEKRLSEAKFHRWMELGVILVVLGAVVVLSVFDKLNPTVGVVLGSLVGYFFGKSKSSE